MNTFVTSMNYLSVFASGTGTNTAKIIGYFANHASIRVACVVTDNPSAPVLDIAAANGIPARAFTRQAFSEATQVLEWLAGHRVNWIVLAGFLSLVPPALIRSFPNRIVNIHPALLPRFGGKGMYGMHVHRAVIDAGSEESGITIHRVNEQYDRGEVVFQEKIKLEAGETPESLMEKVRLLELRHYPRVIEKLVNAAT